MKPARIIYLFVFYLISGLVQAQTSPLFTGKWAKIAAQKQGIYKLTGAQIRTLGFSLPITSSQLQLFNFDFSQLSEKVPVDPSKGLTENTIQVMDGGDGKIDDNDFVLFYNKGTVEWKFDSSSNRMKHFKNASVDVNYFFITIGSNGKRVVVQSNNNAATETISDFNQHFVFEQDSISLLNSGKTLWGLPMGQGVGKQSQLVYNLNTQGMRSTDKYSVFVQMASTSYQNGANFSFAWNDQSAHTSTLPAVSGLLFDDIASVLIDSFASPVMSSWPNTCTLKVNYNSANSNATGWIDYVEFNSKKQVGFWQDSVISFNIEEGYVQGKNYNCTIQNADTTALLWNVTNPSAIMQVPLLFQFNGMASFSQLTNENIRFFGVRQNAYESPILMGMLPNQNTFNVTNATDYIIVAAPAYLNAAKKYQAFQKTVFARNAIVADASELYNDFSGGQNSAIAIRNYVKFLFNKAKSNNWPMPKYLLLLGTGNFNSRKLQVDFELPVYESENSNSILSSYSSDDFFAILNDYDDIHYTTAIKQLSIAVGRIPARTIAEADSTIQKLIYYQTNTAGGNWENKLTWVADDGDYNLHLQDAEEIIQHLQSKAPKWDQQKIYLDLYPAVSSSAGNTYPLAFNAIQQSVQDGTLIINYTGHGNYLRLSEEAVIDQAQFDTWNNKNKLPLMVTASCNFAPYDQPGLSPIAYDALMKNSKGVIGLVAANRLVFAFSNKQINDLFIQQLLVPDSIGHYVSIGQALQKAKMLNWSQGGDHINALKFSLLGDPALQLLSPNYTISVKQINSKSFNGQDTLLSGNKYNVQGIVQQGSNPITDFNGVMELIIYDAVKYKKTLANQSTSMSVPIAMQENILFKGKATVVNGKFSIDFILPAQVSNVNSPLRLSFVATSNLNSAIQILDSIYVKANGIANITDTTGPIINAYLNDPLFKQGGWAGPNSILYITLNDSSGIQTSGNALGHDLAIWMDENPVPIIINNYFIADMDTYKSGRIVYALPQMTTGKHNIIIKAWDLLGNSTTDSLFFEVPSAQNPMLKNATNFPNPVISQTRFGFETNQLGKEIQTQLEIMDLKGQVLYVNSNKFINNNTSIHIDWDGVTASGTDLKKGVYFYRITVNSGLKISQLSNSFIKL